MIKQNQLPHLNAGHCLKNKRLPLIVEKINNSRNELNDMMSRNHQKLNSSFSLYLENEVSLGQDDLRKKKITKLKKVEDQR